MRSQILDKILINRQLQKKSLAVLLDPDKVELEHFPAFLHACVQNHVDLFFVGGSLITTYATDEIIAAIHQHTDLPAVLFPGNSLHVEASADAILLLSLISGRNPEFLIGQHVIAAPILKKSKLEILPTGYMLVESGRATTVSYISNTTPIPRDKPSVAACTALAGEMLGLQLIYMDAGSGAHSPITPEMIAAVRQTVELPIIVGGGINTPQKAQTALQAGADVIVIGNGIEQNPSLLPAIGALMAQFKTIEA